MPTHRDLIRERLELLLARGWEALDQNPLSAALPAREAEHLARTIGDNYAWAQSLLILGAASLYEGQPADAITVLTQSLATYRFLGHKEGQWYCLSAIAKAWHYLGDTDQASETQALATGFAQREGFERTASWLRWFEAV